MIDKNLLLSIVVFYFWVLFSRFEVAIKEAIVQNARYELLEEAKAMIRVSKHDHIVNLQGICDGNDSVYLLLEFCALGPIDDFLKVA